MVEFALVLPILCVLLFGIIQCGVLYNDYLTLTDATRVGARKAAVSRTAADPVAVAKAAVRNAATDFDTASLGISVNGRGWSSGADVTVETTYPYELDIMGIVVADGDLRSKITERIE